MNVTDSHFINNTAHDGAVMHLSDIQSGVLMMQNSLTNNLAEHHGVIYSFGSTVVIQDMVLEDNTGSMYTYNCNLTFERNITFMNNILPHLGEQQEGGALTTFYSNVIILGHLHLLYNKAKDGGAILSVNSKLHVYRSTTIANNIALDTGCGIYFYQSQLFCHDQSKLELKNNHATNAGGGIHAIDSIISIELDRTNDTRITFLENTANNGGGVYLEVNAKIQILKKHLRYEHSLVFKSNIAAQYGGAMFLADDTYSATCYSNSSLMYSATTECFLQTIALFSYQSRKLSLVTIEFTDNLAAISGSNLYGGLLDRYTVSPFTDVYWFTNEGR